MPPTSWGWESGGGNLCTTNSLDSMMALPSSLYLNSTRRPALHKIRISLLSWLYPQEPRAPHENDRSAKPELTSEAQAV